MNWNFKIEAGLLWGIIPSIKLRFSVDNQKSDEDEEKLQLILNEIHQTSENQTSYAKNNFSRFPKIQHAEDGINLKESDEETDLKKSKLAKKRTRQTGIKGCLVKLHIKKLFRFLILLSLLKECDGAIIGKPNHIIILAGNGITLSCKSDHLPVYWQHSAAKQREVKLVSEAFYAEDSFSQRFQEFIDNIIKTSNFTLKNVTIMDAGILYCTEDGDFPKREPVRLTVVADIRCLAACVEGHLLVTCSTCYWGEDDLVFLLRLRIDVKPNSNTRTENSERLCIEYEALWDIKTTCANIHQRNITVTLKENSTEVALQPDTLLNILFKDQEISVTKSSQASVRIVSFISDEIQTEKSKDFNNNINNNTFIIAITGGLSAIVISITIGVHYIIYRSWRQRMASRSQEAQINDTELQLMNVDNTTAECCDATQNT